MKTRNVLIATFETPPMKCCYWVNLIIAAIKVLSGSAGTEQTNTRPAGNRDGGHLVACVAGVDQHRRGGRKGKVSSKRRLCCAAEHEDPLPRRCRMVNAQDGEALARYQPTDHAFVALISAAPSDADITITAGIRW